MAADIPTLFEWAGGTEALGRLTRAFYDKVLADELLEPVFRNMSPDHPGHVAAFIGEVFGGPKTYSGSLGGHRAMVMHHLDRHLTEQQRRRWVELLVDAADQTGLPDDPEFRSAFVAYVEWGTRLARVNSELGPEHQPAEEPMPRWGWGVPGGPYRPLG
ncbi:group II truncated hemoglobin [Rhizobiaceae sp. 2RAB30]